MDERYSLALRKLALMGAMDDFVSISSREFGDMLNMSQQSASKRILELLDDGMIVRDLGARKQRIKITQQGFDEMMNEYNEYRRIFDVNEQTLHGTVTSGLGEGGWYISRDGYKNQIKEKLGYSPFDGTFNVRLCPEDVKKLNFMKSSTGIMIEGFTEGNRTFGNVKAFKAKIRNIDCAIVMPERTLYQEVIEIVCQYHLRRTLSLKDGDPIEVKVIISE